MRAEEFDAAPSRNDRQVDTHRTIEIFNGRTTQVFGSRGRIRGAVNELIVDCWSGLTSLLSLPSFLRLPLDDKISGKHMLQRLTFCLKHHQFNSRHVPNTFRENPRSKCTEKTQGCDSQPPTGAKQQCPTSNLTHC